MTAQKIIEILGEWEGYRVNVAGSAPGNPSEVWIELLPHKTSGRSSGCESPARSVHDTTLRWIRDLTGLWKSNKADGHAPQGAVSRMRPQAQSIELE